MKKFKILGFALGTALLSAFLFLGTAAVAPEEACAGNCQIEWWTMYEWGMGWTCNDARSACYSDAYSAAQAVCEAENKNLCQLGTYTESSCYIAGGQMQVDCTLQYKCGNGPDSPF